MFPIVRHMRKTVKSVKYREFFIFKLCEFFTKNICF